MHHDCRGLVLTTDSAIAASAFDLAIRQFLEYRATLMDTLERLLQADAEFALGHCFKGFMLMSAYSHETHPLAWECLAAAQRQHHRVTRRERLHIDALDAWLAGDLQQMRGYWEAILEDHPLDILALRLHHSATFWQGDARAMANMCARVLPCWDHQDPAYGMILGMYAFGLDQCNAPQQGEALGREAVARNPADLWSVHAVAHIYETQGRLQDGVSWLSECLDEGTDQLPIKRHLWWHRCLFLLELGRIEEIFTLLDGHLWPQDKLLYLDIQNLSSLMWRLELAGIEVGDRWAGLAESLRARIGNHQLPFTDSTVALGLARVDPAGAGGRWRASLAEHARGEFLPARVSASVLAPLADGLLAYGQGDYATATNQLLSVKDALQTLGGSHPQRDIFAQLLIEAARRAGRLNLARGLLAERVANRPNSALAWRGYVGVLETLGLEDQLAGARGELARLEALL